MFQYKRYIKDDKIGILEYISSISEYKRNTLKYNRFLGAFRSFFPIFSLQGNPLYLGGLFYSYRYCSASSVSCSLI